MESSNTVSVFLVLFFLFLLALIVLDIFMLVSLVRPGDERRQMIVWKSSAFTLLSTAGSLALEILVDLASNRPLDQSNPFVQLGVMSLVFFLATIYYKRKYSV